jgi:predicted kinase
VGRTLAAGPTLPECIILIGLPGAGKTTFYRERFADTHHHVSKDLWPNARNRDARQRQEIDRALTDGRGVIVDNLNASAADRAPLVAIARARGARVIGYFFDVTTRQAVARNAERTGRQRVPNVAIFTAAKRLDVPRWEEGFDELFRVEITPERGFQVHPIAVRSSEDAKI